MSAVIPPKTILRKNSAGSEISRRRLNVIEGTNITITTADDSVDNEIDLTIATASSVVTGPGSSTDNAIVRWDGTTGTFIQNSLLTIDDTGALVFEPTVYITTESGVFTFNENVDRQFKIDFSGGTSGKTLTLLSAVTNDRTLNLPDADGTLVFFSASGVDNRIVRWDGTSAVQNSGVTLSDSGVASNLLLEDSSCAIVDAADSSKRIKFNPLSFTASSNYELDFNFTGVAGNFNLSFPDGTAGGSDVLASSQNQIQLLNKALEAPTTEFFSTNSNYATMKFSINDDPSSPLTTMAISSTANRTITFPDASGTVLLATGAFTAGSILFSNGTNIAQDNANFFWDDTNNRMGIGTNSLSNSKLAIVSSSGTDGGIVISVLGGAEVGIDVLCANDIGIYSQSNTDDAIVGSAAGAGIGISGESNMGISGFFRTSDGTGANGEPTLVTQLNTAQIGAMLDFRDSGGVSMCSVTSDGTLIYTDKFNILNNSFFADGVDTTKRWGWDTSGATSGTTTSFLFVQTANRVITFPNSNGTVALTTTVAPISATYLTLSSNPQLTGERVATQTAGQITITDAGANSTATWAFANPVTTFNVTDAGLSIKDDGDNTKIFKVQASGISTGTTRTWTVPDASSTFVGTDATQTLTNKTLDNTNTVTLKDTLFTIQDDADTTKQAVFQASSISTGTTRTYTFPNQSGTLFILPSLTSGSVLFSDGTTIAQDNSNFFWDDTNNRLGIATTSPSQPLHVAGNILIGTTNKLMLGSTTAFIQNTQFLGLDTVNITSPSTFLISCAGLTNSHVDITLNSNTASVFTVGSSSQFNVRSDGLISKYNNIATVANGVPSELAQVNLTGQSAAITATTFYTTTSTGAGLYRISWTAKVTTAASTSSVLGDATGLQITYTDAVDSVVTTTQANISGSTNSGNTTGSDANGVIIVNAKASTNIQYAYGYTSVGLTAMQYRLNIKLEAL